MRVHALPPALRSVLDAQPEAAIDTAALAAAIDTLDAAEPADSARALRHVLDRHAPRLEPEAQALLRSHRIAAEDPGLAALPSIQTSCSAAVEAARASVRRLETRVAGLEAEHSSKAAALDAAVLAIAGRETELRANYETKRRNAVIFALFGYPQVGAASLVMAMNDDARLQTLKSQRAHAEQSRDAALTTLTGYRTRRDRASQALQQLRKAESALIDAADRAPSVRSGNYAQIAAVAARLESRQGLADNLRRQVEILERIAADAADVGGKLDTALTSVRARLEAVEALAESSRGELFELVRIVAGVEPEAAAAKWLEAQVQKTIRQALKKAGLDPKTIVDDLVERALPGAAGTPAGAALRDAILAPT